MLVARNIKIAGAVLLSVAAAVAFAGSATVIIMAQSDNNPNTQMCDGDSLTLGDIRDLSDKEILCDTDTGEENYTQFVSDIRSHIEDLVATGDITQAEADALNGWIDNTPGFISAPSVLEERIRNLDYDDPIFDDFSNLFLDGITNSFITSIYFISDTTQFNRLLSPLTNTATAVNPAMSGESLTMYQDSPIFIPPEGTALPENYKSLSGKELEAALLEADLEDYQIDPDIITNGDDAAGLENTGASNLGDNIRREAIKFALEIGLINAGESQDATNWLDRQPVFINGIFVDFFDDLENRRPRRAKGDGTVLERLKNSGLIDSRTFFGVNVQGFSNLDDYVQERAIDFALENEQITTAEAQRAAEWLANKPVFLDDVVSSFGGRFANSALDDVVSSFGGRFANNALGEIQSRGTVAEELVVDTGNLNFDKSGYTDLSDFILQNLIESLLESNIITAAEASQTTDWFDDKPDFADEVFSKIFIDPANFGASVDERVNKTNEE